MATVGQIWKDPNGDLYLVTGESADGKNVLIAGSWLPCDLTNIGWMLVSIGCSFTRTSGE